MLGCWGQDTGVIKCANLTLSTSSQSTSKPMIITKLHMRERESNQERKLSKQYTASNHITRPSPILLSISQLQILHTHQILYALSSNPKEIADRGPRTNNENPVPQFPHVELVRYVSCSQKLSFRTYRMTQRRVGTDSTSLL